MFMLTDRWFEAVGKAKPAKIGFWSGFGAMQVWSKDVAKCMFDQ